MCSRCTPHPTYMFQAIRQRLIVDPYYDADKIGSIYIPEPFKNPEPQQGVVVNAGPESSIAAGEYIFFHPFRHEPLAESGLISIEDKDVVAILKDGELYPLDEHLMILPDWASKYKQPEHIYLPPDVLEDYSPVLFGTVVRYGNHAQPLLNRRVVIPPRKGSEIGYKDTVYYFIHQDEILATVNASDH